ncbi:MAG: hypothetical protein Q4G69_10165 [Planctomycetia bacterium]|nr:hypothetical protein [Planctomycetia bacterium]
MDKVKFFYSKYAVLAIFAAICLTLGGLNLCIGAEPGFASTGKNAPSQAPWSPSDLPVGVPRPVEYKKKTEYGTIKSVSDVAVMKKGDLYNTGSSLPANTAEDGNRRVISQYSNDTLDDMIDNLDQPVKVRRPVSKRGSQVRMKNSPDSLLLDSNFSLDELVEGSDPQEAVPEVPEEIHSPNRSMGEKAVASLRTPAARPREIVSADKAEKKANRFYDISPEHLNAPKAIQAPVPEQKSAPAAVSILNEKKNTMVEEGLLVAFQSPVINIRTLGPKKIIVGQESLYQICVLNSSSVDAKKLTITTDIPASVEIAGIQPSVGNTSLVPSADGMKPCKSSWQIDFLPAGKEEVLNLNLVPRQRSNFDLVCRYDLEESSAKAGIEVQEAVLELKIEGKDNLEWGVEDQYRLKLRNSGNGDAENIRLIVSTGNDEKATQIVDLLPAGEEKTMDLSVRTLLDGSITIAAEASAGHGVSVRAQKEVKILRGNLQVNVEAPELQFVNNTTDYFVRISNTGTAAVKGVKISAILPPGVKYLSSTGSGKEIAGRGEVQWEIPSLAQEEQIVYQVSCQMLRPGVSRVDIAANDTTGLSALGSASVQVEAIAALNMRIKAPNGPVAVGSPVSYMITITNTGTKAASNVNAGFLLGRGMRPVAVEGNNGIVYPNDMKVVFNKIPILSAGQSVSWKVEAEAIIAGNHKVQAVLEAPSENIQLNTEEMTYCYERKIAANRNGNNSQIAMGSMSKQEAPLPSAIGQKPQPSILPGPAPLSTAPLPAPAKIPAPAVQPQKKELMNPLLPMNVSFNPGPAAGTDPLKIAPAEALPLGK